MLDFFKDRYKPEYGELYVTYIINLIFSIWLMLLLSYIGFHNIHSIIVSSMFMWLFSLITTRKTIHTFWSLFGKTYKLQIYDGDFTESTKRLNDFYSIKKELKLKKNKHYIMHNSRIIFLKNKEDYVKYKLLAQY